MDFLFIKRKENGHFDFVFDGRRYDSKREVKKDFFIANQSDMQIIKTEGGHTYHVFYTFAEGYSIDYFKMCLQACLSEKESIDAAYLQYELMPILKNEAERVMQLKVGDNNHPQMKTYIIIVDENTTYEIVDYFLVSEFENCYGSTHIFEEVFSTLDGSFKDNAIKVATLEITFNGAYPICVGSTDSDEILCHFKDGEKYVNKEEFTWQ